VARFAGHHQEHRCQELSFMVGHEQAHIHIAGIVLMPVLQYRPKVLLAVQGNPVPEGGLPVKGIPGVEVFRSVAFYPDPLRMESLML
jgi:hypothetical protein